MVEVRVGDPKLVLGLPLPSPLGPSLDLGLPQLQLKPSGGGVVFQAFLVFCFASIWA